MSIRDVLVCAVFATFLPASATAGEKETEQPSPPPEPKKLVAAAFISVGRMSGPSETLRQHIAKIAREALPADRFEKLTVLEAKDVKEARIKAATVEAQVFLHVALLEPKKITHSREVPVRRGRWRRTINVQMPFHTLRTPVVVEMSVAAGKSWRKAATVKISSADVPGAEAESMQERKDISPEWAKAVRLIVPAGCERALGTHFLRHVSVRAVEGSPREGEQRGDAAPPTLVKIELTNRSHCRILEATVTVEQFNDARKRWEAVGVPLRPAGGRPRRRRATLAGKVTWTIPASVDPGQKALSHEKSISEEVLQTMKSGKCRLVLHATPAVWKLYQPKHPHPVKRPPAPKP